jgi:hypothetical protein
MAQLGQIQLASAPLIPSYMGLGLGSNKVIIASGLTAFNVTITVLSTK